jgi:4-amino-4-deoxychorismate lyase
MCLLFESVRIENGKLSNISFHNERLNSSIRELFGMDKKYDLEKLIGLPVNLPEGKIKCRIVYSSEIISITLQKYEIRKLNSLQLVQDDSLDYEYKYENRECIEKLKYGIKSDDILIVKNGLITDSSFSNIVFWDGDKWITPASPLLKGTMRSSLLKESRIHEEDLRKSDIRFFKYAGLINSMMGLEECIKIDVENIF